MAATTEDGRLTTDAAKGPLKTGVRKKETEGTRHSIGGRIGCEAYEPDMREGRECPAAANEK
jgi:hypothetical protein